MPLLLRSPQCFFVPDKAVAACKCHGANALCCVTTTKVQLRVLRNIIVMVPFKSSVSAECTGWFRLLWGWWYTFYETRNAQGASCSMLCCAMLHWKYSRAFAERQGSASLLKRYCGPVVCSGLSGSKSLAMGPVDKDGLSKDSHAGVPCCSSTKLKEV